MRYRDVPGLSGAANAAVRALERDRLSPGVVAAAFMLPPMAAAELRARIDPLDAVLLGRTHHEPAADPGLAWWHRRC